MSYILLKDCIGEDRGWKVNMMAVELWTKNIDDDAFNSTSVYSATYAGLMANCKAKQQEPNFTFEQVCEWVDEINLTEEGVKIISEIKVKFEESQYYIALVKKLKETLSEITEDKKKLEMTLS